MIFREISFAIILLALTTPLGAEPQTQRVDTAPLMAPVKVFVEAYNAHRLEYPEGVFIDDAPIIDDFAPYFWSGPGSARQWYADLMGKTGEEQAKTRAMKFHVEIGEAKFVEVTSDRAYFVVLSTLSWQDKETAKKESAQWVFIEVKTKDGWRISAHSWAVSSVP